MSYKDDIRRIAKQDEPKKGLAILQERAGIPASVNAPVSSKTEELTSPLTLDVLTTDTVRVYQNNDINSSNWVDVERALTANMIDSNGKVFFINSIIWPE